MLVDGKCVVRQIKQSQYGFKLDKENKTLPGQKTATVMKLQHEQQNYHTHNNNNYINKLKKEQKTDHWCNEIKNSHVKKKHIVTHYIDTEDG